MATMKPRLSATTFAERWQGFDRKPRDGRGRLMVQALEQESVAVCSGGDNNFRITIGVGLSNNKAQTMMQWMDIDDVWYGSLPESYFYEEIRISCNQIPEPEPFNRSPRYLTVFILAPKDQLQGLAQQVRRALRSDPDEEDPEPPMQAWYTFSPHDLFQYKKAVEKATSDRLGVTITGITNTFSSAEERQAYLDSIKPGGSGPQSGDVFSSRKEATDAFQKKT